MLNKTAPGHISVLQECKLHNYKWVSDAETQVRSVIKYYADSLLAEAKGCDCVRLLDENEMYRQFKENADNEEEIANKYVCKFFAVKMYIKALFWTLGEWKFTEQDREMFKYFNEHSSRYGINRKAFRFNYASHNDMTCYSNIIDKLHTSYEAFGILTDIDAYYNRYSHVYNFDPFRDLESILICIDCILNGYNSDNMKLSDIFEWKNTWFFNSVELHDIDETHLFSTLKKVTSNVLTSVTSYFK